MRSPLIHILYEELEELILKPMRRFLKSDTIGTRRGAELHKVDLKDVLSRPMSAKNV